MLTCATTCRAEEASGATLVRKCEIYLYGAKGRLPSDQAAADAAYCAGFIDSTIAAARLAHEQRGFLRPDGEPPGKVDKKAYQTFATNLRFGLDICLPDDIATREVARKFRLTVSLNRELLWADELTSLDFVLVESYPCKRASL